MSASLLSYEGWKSLNLAMTITVWCAGIFAIFCGIVAFWANSNAEIAKNDPRGLTDAQVSSLQNSEAAANNVIANQPNSAQYKNETTAEVEPRSRIIQSKLECVLIVAVGGSESNKYASEIANALSGKFSIKRFEIGAMNPPQVGLTFISNGEDASQLLQVLARAGLKAQPNDLPFLPVPGSVRSQFAGCIGLIVGSKPVQ